MQRTDFSIGLDKRDLSDNENNKMNKPNDTAKSQLDRIFFLQIMIIIFLLINIAVTAIGSTEAIIEIGDIDFENTNVVGEPKEYYVHIHLKNTGSAEAIVSVMGEGIFSSMEEGQRFEPMAYKNVVIAPGETKDVNIGKFETYHYILKIYINWNGGSIIYSQKVR